MAVRYVRTAAEHSLLTRVWHRGPVLWNNRRGRSPSTARLGFTLNPDIIAKFPGHSRN